jgi:hypothetical protein
MYLLIENYSEAPIESFTLLGASSARGTDKIGQFGTGTKHGINLLLRQGIPFRVYSGKDKVEFDTQAIDFQGREQFKVTYSVNGRKTRDTGWTLDWGAMDWRHVNMALREFISNAIDSGEVWDVSIVDECRAKAGWTRVFIKVNEDVQRFYNERAKWFLHFRNHNLVDRTILPKLDANTPARVYRRGVLVRQLGTQYPASRYDYNIEIDLDDCRNSSDSQCVAAIGKAISAASAEVKADILQAGDVHETTIDDWYLTDQYGDNLEERKASWKEAWNMIGGGVAVEPDCNRIKYLEREGYQARTVKSSKVLRTLEAAGVKTATSALGAGPHFELASSISFNVQEAFDTYCNFLEELQIIDGERPELAEFYEAVSCDEDVVYESGKVYFKHGSDTEKLLPEIVRHYTFDVQGTLVKIIEAMRVAV